MLGPSPTIQGPLPKIVPVLITGLRDLGCEVYEEVWGRRRDDETWVRKLVQRLGDVRRVRRVLREHAFDLLVVTTAHDWQTLSRDIPLLLATRGLCAHRVLQFHGCFVDRLVAPGHSAFKLASAVLIRLSDAALVLSSEEQRQWQAFYPRGQVYVVSYPYVPAALPCPPAPRRSLGVPDGVPILLFVGRVMEAKGVFELIAALPQVSARTPCHLLVVGDGPEVPEVRRRVSAAGIGAHVTLAGYLEGDALRAAYGCADVFVLPSWSESLPLSMVEAMEAGLPVVTTRIRGMADHVRDGVHGFLTPPRDIAALAEALARILGDAGMRARMGQANQEKVREFAPDVVARHYLGVLQGLMDSRTHA